jgi:hypothetical protein
MNYRKIDPRIWNDQKFNSLSDKGKLVFFFLLTHPHMTPVGAMRGTMAGFAEELGWETKAFREAFREPLLKGMVKHNQEAHFVSLPNFIKYNPPESPNVVTAWAKCMDDIPECLEKDQLYYDLKALLQGYKEAFREAFAKAFVKPTLKTMSNQEQEQEQEQEQDNTPPKTPPQGGGTPSNGSYTKAFLEFWEAYPLKVGKKAAFRAWKKARDKPPVEEILSAICKQHESRKWQEGFIPNPATWINQGRWEDVIETQRDEEEDAWRRFREEHPEAYQVAQENGPDT